MQSTCSFCSQTGHAATNGTWFTTCLVLRQLEARGRLDINKWLVADAPSEYKQWAEAMKRRGCGVPIIVGMLSQQGYITPYQGPLVPKSSTVTAEVMGACGGVSACLRVHAPPDDVMMVLAVATLLRLCMLRCQVVSKMQSELAALRETVATLQARVSASDLERVCTQRATAQQS